MLCKRDVVVIVALYTRCSFPIRVVDMSQEKRKTVAGILVDFFVVVALVVSNSKSY